MGFDLIHDILKKIQSRNPSLSKRIDEANALSRWEAAVGPAISKHTRAIRIQDSVLWIEVDSPIWKTELHYRKRQILDLLNQTQVAKPKAEITLAQAAALAKRQSEAEVIKDILFLDARLPQNSRQGSKKF